MPIVSTPKISVIVPAYNEEKRIPPALKELLQYLRHSGSSFEVIVVNDGSSDGTVDVVKQFQAEYSELKLIDVGSNQGKGNAVQQGDLAATGEIIGFLDADGSTPATEIAKMVKAIEEGADVAIGSRAIDSSETKVKTNIYRKALGRAFNTCINLFLIPGIRDTQCGCKFMKKAAAKFLFKRQTNKRFSFDFEILHIAWRVGLKIAEIPVNWSDVKGSKVHPWRDGLRMLRDIVIFRWRHWGLSPKDYQR